ncbi:hypothetical protein ULMS_21660 [Patiriisocius marinistellae]|uniref:Uncharacterized protein n=1 Tax=Patiriisocius marinistellae TaxID=2494560 RepID=A0A5J4FZ30_9FLAO|nr:hypothetical protein [Patiriisocius marinistellae]GEQ86658.1 hypothetical protein ULMS_21660 [Patiriisocius marinistellae]
MFEKLRRKNLQKQIDKALLNRDVSGRNGKIKSLAFLYNEDVISSVSEMKKIADVLNISEEQITFLSFVTFDKKNTSLTCEQFTNRDFSWKGDLKRKELKDFVHIQFDALVYFQDGSHEFLDIVAARSAAKFKIGLLNSDERIHDLMISVTAKEIDKAAQEIKKYLQIMGKLDI